LLTKSDATPDPRVFSRGAFARLATALESNMKKTTKQFIQNVERKAQVKFSRIEPAGSGHIRCWVDGISQAFILPSTPANQHRSMLNAASYVRRTVKEARV
jgi:hypothetical protein